MNLTKFFIFLLYCSNGVLARLPFFSFYQTDLESGIIETDPKGTGQRELPDDVQKTMEKMKKMMCKIVYPMPCTNLRIKITSFESTEKTTIKLQQKRAEWKKDKMDFMLRQLKR